MLLGEQGKVRSDDDFVFYNQPTGPGVKLSSGATDTITIDTAAVPADVHKIVVTASLDSASFNGMELILTVRDAATRRLIAPFIPPKLGTVTALVVAEVYRHRGAWKVRAVGLGHANGLGGLATDFGVNVEGQAAPAAAPTPTPQGSVPASVEMVTVLATAAVTTAVVPFIQALVAKAAEDAYGEARKLVRRLLRRPDTDSSGPEPVQLVVSDPQAGIELLLREDITDEQLQALTHLDIDQLRRFTPERGTVRLVYNAAAKEWRLTGDA